MAADAEPEPRQRAGSRQFLEQRDGLDRPPDLGGRQWQQLWLRSWNELDRPVEWSHLGAGFIAHVRRWHQSLRRGVYPLRQIVGCRTERQRRRFHERRDLAVDRLRLDACADPGPERRRRWPLWCGRDIPLECMGG